MKPKEDISTIYEAALEVFAEYGFKKATLEDIAGQLGMTKGNLYRYARNKKDLYRNTVRYALLRWQGRLNLLSRDPRFSQLSVVGKGAGRHRGGVERRAAVPCHVPQSGGLPGRG